jgi:hypothetical protein
MPLMKRPAFLSLLVFALTVSALAQVNIPGVLSTRPASVPDSRVRSVRPAAAAQAPDRSSHGGSSAGKPAQSSHRVSVHLPMPLFGDPHHHSKEIVAIPLFYPVYLYPYPNPNNSVAPEEPQAAADAPASPDDQALQDAYNRGAQDALAQQRSQTRNDAPAQPTNVKPAPAPFIEPEPDNGPPTVFIFKDGHRVETRSYAIMGQTLFDLSSKPVRKIQLDDLDLAATTKVNDDMGNPLRF